MPIIDHAGRISARLIIPLLAVVLLNGCAAPLQSTRLTAQPPSDLPPVHELEDTPFFPQEEYQCGPAALATVLGAAGSSVRPEDLTPQIYLPGRQGSLQTELVAAARRQGHVPYPLTPGVEALLREVAAGHPVLVFQNLGLDWQPLWHYAVVVGYDLEERLVVLRSGRQERRVTKLATFERTWRRADYWALVVLPPDVPPKTAEELRYLGAVAGLEETGQWLAASRAYRSALALWPQSILAAMGAGNSAYALGRPSDAAQFYRQVLAINPNYPPAHNNLAYALLALDDGDGALGHARRAVALGGEHRQEYLASLREIEQRLSSGH